VAFQQHFFLECAMMDAKAVVIEKRKYFTWPWTMHYFISLGAKTFYLKFGTEKIVNSYKLSHFP